MLFNKNILLKLFLFFVCSGILLAQNSRQLTRIPSGLGISNQMEYSYDYEKGQDIFENWLNLDYNHGIFSTGIRFDVFQPNDPSPAISRGKNNYADIGFKYIEVKLGKIREGLNVRVGNFYSSIGRGLILKSYENRNIRIDNNLLGVKLEGRYKSIKIKAMSGTAENAMAERKDILHIADVEYRVMKGFKFGATFARLNPENSSVGITEMKSVRIEPKFMNIDFYSEFGVKDNSIINQNRFNGNEPYIGKGFYSSINFGIGALGITAEYKHYDNFAFTSSDGTVFYNTPPSLRKDYSFILLNRHPSPLDANNEKGFQVELSYSYSDDSFMSLSGAETRTLTNDSYYQRINSFSLAERTSLLEGFFQINHKWNNKIKTIAAIGYNEELSSDTKNISPVIEVDYFLSATKTFRFILEHLSVSENLTGEKYFTDVILVEYLNSPNLSLAVVGEVQTKEPTPGNIVRKFWGFVQLGYKFWENTDVSVLVGSRQSGNICIGGVCRYEPEFSGIELKMITTL